MRLYISADIEGIVGVVTREQTLPSGFEFQAARIWMTDTVVAAAEAAFEMGVDEVVVSDSHGAKQNIIIDRLPRRVQLVRGKPRMLDMVSGIEVGSYGGAMFLGWHTGSTHLSGVLGHTMRGLVVREIQVNGRVVSEAGFYHPLIGISGDADFVSETRELVGDVEAAVVKWAYGHLSARSMVPADAHAEVAAMTRRALGRIETFKPYRIEGEITLDVSFKHRPPAEVLSLLPMVERLDAYTIRTVLPDMRVAANFMTVALGYNPSEQ